MAPKQMGKKNTLQTVNPNTIDGLRVLSSRIEDVKYNIHRAKGQKSNKYKGYTYNLGDRTFIADARSDVMKQLHIAQRNAVTHLESTYDTIANKEDEVAILLDRFMRIHEEVKDLRSILDPSNTKSAMSAFTTVVDKYRAQLNDLKAQKALKAQIPAQAPAKPIEVSTEIAAVVASATAAADTVVASAVAIADAKKPAMVVPIEQLLTAEELEELNEW